jgi:surfeit locus 1 family protein
MRTVPWWGWALAAMGIAITLSAGFWQLGRAEAKRSMQTRIDDLGKAPALRLSGRETDAAPFLLRRVEAVGRWDASRQVWLDNRVYKGRAGYHVVTPLALGGNRHVLVNRGWIAASGERGKLPRVNTPSGEVAVKGIAVEGATRYVELSTRVAEGNVWQNLVLARYRAATGLDVLPFIVRQDADAADDGLTRDWPPADSRRDTHLAYAVQWFGMALAILAYMVFLYVRNRRSATA